MTPFLKQVADIYATNETDNLHRYCFIFPNKRSGTFFHHHLIEALASKSVLMPRITTITDFVSDFSELAEANRYEQLFTLYDEYRKLPGVDIDFNKFVFWGDMLMNDFNDVDRYLVDPSKIFDNVKRLREISTNYLTPNQISAVKRYWGVQLPSGDRDHMWNHIEYADRPASQNKFARMWQVMHPLYMAYTRRLKEKGLATQGMLYRNAAESLAPGADGDIPYDRCIFVGFNVLTTSEHKIFSRLQMRKKADFYWDFDTPMAKVPHNRAGKFISRNMRDYPSLYSLPEYKCDHIPHIEILAVSSHTGQAKVAGEQLGKWLSSHKIADPDNATDTAVVLPDESLFIPVIHSVPKNISNINVTMGFPIRHTPIASLMNSIISLQLRSRKRSANGEVTYFFEDVKSLLTTPGIRTQSPDGVNKILTEILKKRLYNVNAQLITEIAPELSPIFAPIDNPDHIESVIEYIRNLCAFLRTGLTDEDRMDTVFIDAYVSAVNRLENAAMDFGVNMNSNSFFKMIERAVHSESINFVGEPLRGLQIMGVLETRALDFDNIIMLSMNERVFPRKHYTRSFIPDALRKDYGMATIDFQESIFAYYFYRLISRAANVTLVYDSRRVGGSRNSGISRYPAQLLYIFGDHDVKHINKLYPQFSSYDGPVTAIKDERVMKRLQRFTEPDNKNLSASAINTYINCPLQFYLKYVEDFNPPDEITDYMDDSTYGSIFHEIAQTVYEDLRPHKGQPFTVTADMLRPYTSPNNIYIEKLIVRTINRRYHLRPDEKLDEPLAGESLVLGKILKSSIREVLKIDMADAPFTYIGSETEMKVRFEIDDDITVNFRQFVDRIDKVGGTMRFIDYKTGDDNISTASLDKLFDTGNDNRAKAILQVLLYCEIYRKMSGDDSPIKPLVYKLRTIMPQGVTPIKINRAPINDYHDVSDEFLQLFRGKIKEIFDKDIPFVQTESNHPCKFCRFTSICHRDVGDDDI